MQAHLHARSAAFDRLSSRLAWPACLVLPVALLHARALAEILIAVIDVSFLVHAVSARDAAWLRRPFAQAGLVWWAWLVVCSALGHGLLLAALALRLPLLAVALGHWVLLEDRRQRSLWLVLGAAFGWIALECWEQITTGHNLFGQGRWADGALTGPFNKPRAGPAFILLFFPVVVPASLALFAANTWPRRLCGGAIVAVSTLTMLLIGQRMPTALMLLGLGLTALLLPRLRWAMLAAGCAGALLVAALPALAPAAGAKLVGETSEQLRHFSQSEYGLILHRALGVVYRHPWTGRGFDGFRQECAAELGYHKIAGVLPPDEVRSCNLHPHNYYLEAADNGGWPGLASFSAMVLTALTLLSAGLWRRPDGWRVGMFVGVVVALFPLASTSAFTSMPNGGWVFLVLGIGLSMRDDVVSRQRPLSRTPRGP